MINLETARLNIRNYSSDDWQDLAELGITYEKSEYAKYDEGPWPNDPEEYKGIAESFSKEDDFLAIVLKEEQKLIGLIAKFKSKDKENEFSFGYNFNSNFHGKGYALESCKVVIKYMFAELNAVNIIAGTAKINEPSIRLLKRLGFKKVGEKIHSFRKDEEGKPIEFIGVDYLLTKPSWLEQQSQ